MTLVLRHCCPQSHRNAFHLSWEARYSRDNKVVARIYMLQGIHALEGNPSAVTFRLFGAGQIPLRALGDAQVPRVKSYETHVTVYGKYRDQQNSDETKFNAAVEATHAPRSSPPPANHGSH
jgi:hypothetical protein